MLPCALMHLPRLHEQFPHALFSCTVFSPVVPLCARFSKQSFFSVTTSSSNAGTSSTGGYSMAGGVTPPSDISMQVKPISKRVAFDKNRRIAFQITIKNVGLACCTQVKLMSVRVSF